MNRVETSNYHQLIVYFLTVFEALEEFSSIHTHPQHPPDPLARQTDLPARRQRFAALWDFLWVIEELEAARPSTIPCRSLRTPAA